MKKVKKVLLSIWIFIIGITNKVSAILKPEPMYGIKEPTEEELFIEKLEKIIKLSKIVILPILFIIGLFVIFNKKITKKTKGLIISILVGIGILVIGIVFILQNNI